MTITDTIAALREALTGLGQDVRRLSDDDLLAHALGRWSSSVPAWAEKPAAERVAALRETYTRRGENVTGLSDLELLNREVSQSYAEANRHHSAYRELLQDRVEYDRSTRAAARREFEDIGETRARAFAEELLKQKLHEINEVIGRAANLPEDGKVPAQQARDLKQAADHVNWLLSGRVGNGRPGMLGRGRSLEDAERLSPAIQLTERQREEILRLRGVIEEQGQRLHAEHGPRPHGKRRCECPGCELTRSMDDVPVEGWRPN